MVSGTVKSESGFEPALDAELYVAPIVPCKDINSRY
jgi:hypothetical protein